MKLRARKLVSEVCYYIASAAIFASCAIVVAIFVAIYIQQMGA